MTGVVVSDASPLHYLVLIDVAAFLPRLFSEVIVPPAVIQELSVVATPAKIREWIAAPPTWLKILTAQHAPNNLGLDLGETQAISLCEGYDFISGFPQHMRESRPTRNRPVVRVAQERGFLVDGTWLSLNGAPGKVGSRLRLPLRRCVQSRSAPLRAAPAASRHAVA